MVPKPTSAKSQVQESDVAANEALLQYAEASKLAKSWLSGSLGNADPNKATEDEADLQKEQELFGKNVAHYSETGGIGFQELQAGQATNASARNPDQTTAFLRKHLLRGHSDFHTTAKPRPGSRPGAQGFHPKRPDSEDEEEGRSGLGKAMSKGKSRKETGEQSHAKGETAAQNTPINAVQAENANTGPAASVDMPSHPRTTKKRGSSYLDEVLASRAAKKNKKMQKNP